MDKLQSCGLSGGQRMNVLAVAMANAIAEGRTINELEFLSALLQLVGEALSVIAAPAALCSDENAEPTS